MKEISVIICAYNEEKTIKRILYTIAESGIFNEIIVVNDGSTDKTPEIILDCKKEVNMLDIHLDANKGKGYAMAVGIENTTTEIVVFCDADLSGLKKEHLLQLTRPIVSNEADMILGQASETLINYKINPFKSFTGERALLKKDILPILEDISTSKFGVETLINLYFQSLGKKVKYVMLEGLKHPTKFEKTNQLQAMKGFVMEGHQIALTAFNNFKLITKSIANSYKQK
jgi:glycosyltransferase involved in cell wall biosynthesis